MKKAMLVYQGGIANVFEVDCFNLNPFGRKAKRIYQGYFEGAQLFCQGLAVAGITVRTAGCNEAGDIMNSQWTENFESLPFAEQLVEMRFN